MVLSLRSLQMLLAPRQRSPWSRILHFLGMTYRNVVINGLLASAFIPSIARWRLLRFHGLKVQPCRIEPRLWCSGIDITIGRDSFLNVGCFLDSSNAPVRIGSGVRFGMEVMLVTSHHTLGDHTQRAAAPAAAPVTIGDGCWLGARVVVMPGVEIGPGCVIASGSVVTEDCTANGLYAGAPAVRKKDLP